jgi:hypothetical protein
VEVEAYFSVDGEEFGSCFGTGEWLNLSELDEISSDSSMKVFRVAVPPPSTVIQPRRRPSFDVKLKTPHEISHNSIVTSNTR